MSIGPMQPDQCYKSVTKRWTLTWIWTGSSSETNPLVPVKLKMFHKMFSFYPEQALGMGFLWEMSLGNVFLWLLCVKMLKLWRGIVKVKYRSSPAYIFFYPPTAFWGCLFTELGFRAFICTRWRTHVEDLLVLMFPLPRPFNRKEKQRSNLFCANGRNDFNFQDIKKSNWVPIKCRHPFEVPLTLMYDARWVCEQWLTLFKIYNILNTCKMFSLSPKRITSD